MLHARGYEHLHRSGLVVLTQDAGDGVSEHALAISSNTKEEEQRLLAGIAGQTVAADPLQVALNVLIATGEAIQEPHPQRARASRTNRGGLGHVVFRPMGS